MSLDLSDINCIKKCLSGSDNLGNCPGYSNFGAPTLFCCSGGCWKIE